jgi:hypothetical protein
MYYIYSAKSIKSNLMKDFSRHKRNLSVLPENEKVLGYTGKGMINERKETAKIIEKAIKKLDAKTKKGKK